MHAAQCFHRDIAPDNILLTATGPLLLDFGAARRVIGDMTHALTVVLKPGYAPIEQYGDVASMTQGAWTDIYALACVVYYAITGRTPDVLGRAPDGRPARADRGRSAGPLRRRLPARDRCRAGGASAGPAAERGPVPRPARHRPADTAALAAQSGYGR
jgi:serine/threonine protein kinase